MSKSAYSSGTRRRNAREIYLEKTSQGRGLSVYGDKRRKTMTNLRSMDDAEVAYRSSSNYLRSMKTDPESSEDFETKLLKSIPRTASASEIVEPTPKPSLGNPKYKTQEDYYDEIRDMKKEFKLIKEENNNLKTKNRRLEEDNQRKRKEIETLLDPNKDGDLRRTLSNGGSTDRGNSANVVMSLKQRIFRLETKLREKENQIDEMEGNPRWTRSAELEIKNRALMSELNRMKTQNFLKKQNHDYLENLEDEQKKAVTKVESERRRLATENQSLKEKLEEAERKLEILPVSTGRSFNEKINGKSEEKLKKFDENGRKVQDLQDKIEEIEEKYQEAKRKRNEAQEQLDNFQQENEKLKEKIEDFKMKIKENENHDKRFRENLTKIKELEEKLKIIETQRDEFSRENSIKINELEEKLKVSETQREEFSRENQNIREKNKKLLDEKKQLEEKFEEAKRESQKIVPLRSTSPDSPPRSPKSTRKTKKISSDEESIRSIQASLRAHFTRQTPTNKIDEKPETNFDKNIPDRIKAEKNSDSANTSSASSHPTFPKVHPKQKSPSPLLDPDKLKTSPKQSDLSRSKNYYDADESIPKPQQRKSLGTSSNMSMVHEDKSVDDDEDVEMG